MSSLNVQRQKTFKIQAFAGLVVVLAYAFTQDISLIESSIYGYALGLISVLLLVKGVKIADDKSASDPKQGMLILYASAVLRFVFVAVMFIIGLSWLNFDPLAVVVPFVVMQISQIFNLRGKRRLTD